MRNNRSRVLRACTLLCASVSLPTMAKAQLSGEAAPPERVLLDENGVNVATGGYRDPHVDLTVGSGPGTLSLSRIYGQIPYQDARIYVRYAYANGTTLSVNVGDKVYGFTKTAGGWTAQGGEGATLTGGSGAFVLTLSDGTRYTYDYTVDRTDYVSGGGGTVSYPEYNYLSKVQRPDGTMLTLTWQVGGYCTYGNTQYDTSTCTPNPNGVGGQRPWVKVVRLQSMTSNAGFQINHSYQRGSFSGNASQAAAQVSDWQRLTGASGSNTQGGSGPLPSVTYAQATTSMSGGGYNQTNDVTDALGRTWRYTKQYLNGSYEAMRRPGSGSDNQRVNMTDSGVVTSIVQDGATWTYSYAVPSSGVSTLSVTDPTNRTRKYTSDLAVGLPTRVEDEYGRATIYTYDASYRLATSTTPGGQVTTYGYDAKGNVTSTVVTQAGGGATLSTSASYADFAFATGTGSRMISSTDVRGQVTSYAYDNTHGGVTRITAPLVNGVNPETRLGYTQVGGVWLVTSVSACRTQASCANTADETRTTTSYNANLLRSSVTAAAGDGSVSATTATTYTAAGDVLSVDGPLAGSDDTVRYYYDAARQRLGAVGPDPDGGGALQRRAVRAGYDGWGRATSVSAGTATDQSDSALANMSVLQVQSAVLDDAGRTKSVALSAGGATYSRVDVSYDAAGRALCTAVRMNPTALGSAGDACTVGADAGDGPDRVSLSAYSPAGAGQPVWTRVTSAYGTTEASSETVKARPSENINAGST